MSKDNYKLYVPTTIENRKIKFSIYYTKDSNNWATNQAIDAGYRVTAVPVTITQRDGFQWEESGAFTGFSDTLVPCSRRSKNREEQAIIALDHNMPKFLEFFQNKGVEFSDEVVESFKRQCMWEGRVKRENIHRIVKMEIEVTSVGMGAKALEAYLAGKIRLTSSNFHNQIRVLLPDLWEKEIKNQYQRYNSYQTEFHLIFISNEEVYHFIKWR